MLLIQQHRQGGVGGRQQEHPNFLLHISSSVHFKSKKNKTKKIICSTVRCLRFLYSTLKKRQVDFFQHVNTICFTSYY